MPGSLDCVGFITHLAKPNTDGSSYATLWCPRELHEVNAMIKNAKVGDWYHLRAKSAKLVPTAPLFETKADHGVLQVRVPVLLFSNYSAKHPVGYAHGIGRIGVFVPADLDKEQFYEGWIARVDPVMLEDVRWRNQLETHLGRYGPNYWIYKKQFPKKLIKLTDLESNGLDLTKGVILTDKDGQYKMWSEKYGMCVLQKEPSSEELKVGTWLDFVAVSNFDDKTIVSNYFPSNAPENIVVHAHPHNFLLKCPIAKRNAEMLYVESIGAIYDDQNTQLKPTDLALIYFDETAQKWKLFAPYVESGPLIVNVITVYMEGEKATFFVLGPDVPCRKIITEKYRFKKPPVVGEFYEMEIQFNENHKYPLVSRTLLLQNTLLDTFFNTKTKFIQVKTIVQMESDYRDGHLFGHSSDFGLVVDKAKVLPKQYVGMRIELWVMSTAPFHEAHWKVAYNTPTPPCIISPCS